MTDTQPFPGASGRARALDPVHLEARLATAGWIPAQGSRWRHPESGIPVDPAGPGRAQPVLHRRCNRGHGRGARSWKPSSPASERAHMDRYVFAPAAAPDQPQPLPTLVQGRPTDGGPGRAPAGSITLRRHALRPRRQRKDGPLGPDPAGAGAGRTHGRGSCSSRRPWRRRPQGSAQPSPPPSSSWQTRETGPWRSCYAPPAGTSPPAPTPTAPAPSPCWSYPACCEAPGTRAAPCAFPPAADPPKRNRNNRKGNRKTHARRHLLRLRRRRGIHADARRQPYAEALLTLHRPRRPGSAPSAHHRPRHTRR